MRSWLNATGRVPPNAYQQNSSRKNGKQIAAIPIAIATPEHIITNGKVDSRIDIVIAHQPYIPLLGCFFSFLRTDGTIAISIRIAETRKIIWIESTNLSISIDATMLLFELLLLLLPLLM